VLKIFCWVSSVRAAKGDFTWLLFLVVVLYPFTSSAWFDETHLAIAKVACYEKWFNAAGPDGAKLKMGDKECHNHFANNPRSAVVTPEMVLAQVERYNQKDPGAVGQWGVFIYYLRLPPCRKSIYQYPSPIPLSRLRLL